MLLSTTFASNLFSTGSNLYGKLGRNKTETELSKAAFFEEVILFDKEELSKIHVGANHVLAIDDVGSLYVWGSNNFGQLGFNDSVANYSVPTQQDYFIGTNVIDCDGGKYHSIVLVNNGSVYTFGGNDSGQLGRQSGDASPGLIVISGIQQNEIVIETRVQQLTTYLLTNKGSVYVFGSCSYYLCGTGFEMDAILSVPTKMNLTFQVTNIFVGLYSLFLKSSDGTIYALGKNEYTQLCLPSSAGDANGYVQTPTAISLSAEDISSSTYHTVLMHSGSAFACGYNRQGTFGNVSSGYYQEPIFISSGVAGVKEIGATESGTILLAESGLYSTGCDPNGELSMGQFGKVQYGFEKVETTFDLKQISGFATHFDFTFMYAAVGKSNGGALGAGAISGIVVGSVIFVAVIVVVIVMMRRAKKLKAQQGEVLED